MHRNQMINALDEIIEARKDAAYKVKITGMSSNYATDSSISSFARYINDSISALEMVRHGICFHPDEYVSENNINQLKQQQRITDELLKLSSKILSQSFNQL